MKTKRNESKFVCPRCGYRLAPVFQRKDPSRRPVSYCCPEPYCDFAENVGGAVGVSALLSWLPWSVPKSETHLPSKGLRQRT